MGPVPFSVGEREGIVVIGEAPGRTEDRLNRPFTGPSGQLIRRKLADYGIKVDQVSWLNVVSCWPNRLDSAPKTSELEACHGNLLDQISYLNPRYCLILGSVAQAHILNLRVKASEVRGHWWEWDYGNPRWTSWCLATWHPASVLRAQRHNNYNSMQFSEDVRLFAKVATMGLEPVLNAWCLYANCEREATEYVQGLGWCGLHVPVYKKVPGITQMELFDEVP